MRPIQPRPPWVRAIVLPLRASLPQSDSDSDSESSARRSAARRRRERSRSEVPTQAAARPPVAPPIAPHRSYSKDYGEHKHHVDRKPEVSPRPQQPDASISHMEKEGVGASKGRHAHHHADGGEDPIKGGTAAAGLPHGQSSIMRESHTPESTVAKRPGFSKVLPTIAHLVRKGVRN